MPVIPVAMIDTEKVMPIGTQLPEGASGRHRHRRAARLLAVRRAWRATASSCARSPTRSCTSSSALSEQEYVDVYASSVREQRAANRGRLERSGGATCGAASHSRRTAPEPSGQSRGTARRASRQRRSLRDRRPRPLADPADQAAAAVARRRGRRRGIRRDRDAAAARLRGRGRHPARRASRARLAARRSCCRAATAPRRSPARRPSRSATA